MRKIFVGMVNEIRYEDSKQAAIFSVGSGEHSCMFITVQSWDEKKEHTEISKFLGKEVAIIIDVIGE